MPTKHADKKRSLEAATGRVNFDETITLGDWQAGYLSLRPSEARKLEDVRENGKIGDLLDFVYPLFTRRFQGEEPPAQAEFEDTAGMEEINAFVAFCSGIKADVAMRMARGESIEDIIEGE